MPWEFLSNSNFSVAYVLLGGFIVTYNFTSLIVKERLYMNEVILGTAFGVLLGPYVLNIVDPRSWTRETDILTREFMRVVLVIGLFAIGVDLPEKYLAKHLKSMLIMVVPTMAFGWFVLAAFIHVLVPKLDFVSSLVISACLTPTDPIVSAVVISGEYAAKHVPAPIRHLLLAESASNDGLAYPFISIAIYLTTEASRKTAYEKWIVIGLLYQVVLGTVMGAVIGYSFSGLLKFGHKRGYLDRESYVAQYISVALFTAGAANSLGNDDLLAAFAAGSAIAWDGDFKKQTNGEAFSTVLDLVLNCACFIYIGAWLPFNQYDIPEIGLSPWRLIVIVLVILSLRRIPCILILYKWMPEVSNWRESLFCGHFGPIGVSAVFVSALAQSRLEVPKNPPASQEDILATALQPIVSFVVFGSIVVHGLSIPVFLIGRRTLALSRSLVMGEQPDWPNWVRRLRPQGDVERIAAASLNETEGEGQDHGTWPRNLKFGEDVTIQHSIVGERADTADTAVADGAEV